MVLIIATWVAVKCESEYVGEYVGIITSSGLNPCGVGFNVVAIFKNNKN